MKKTLSIKNGIRNTALGLGALFMVGCSSYNIIRKQEVPSIPSGQYKRIIKLANPEGTPDRTLAGVVFIKKGAKVCTDYPREETIKSIDEMELREKQAYSYFRNYAIKAGDEIFGFVSIPADYGTNIWENKKNADCKYKVEIILPKSTKGTGYDPPEISIP